jgi:hypothetical protein
MEDAAHQIDKDRQHWKEYHLQWRASESNRSRTQQANTIINNLLPKTPPAKMATAPTDVAES